MLRDATVGDCCMVKAVVQALFSDRLIDIFRSPEWPDLRLSKEEAQGHLIGNLVIGEQLADEGRAVGERASTTWSPKRPETPRRPKKRPRVRARQREL